MIIVAAPYSTVRRFLLTSRVESYIYFELLKSSGEAGFPSLNLLSTKAECNAEMGFSDGF